MEFDPITYEVTESGSVAFMIVLRTQSQRQITVFFATNEGLATCKSVITVVLTCHYILLLL